MNQLKTPPNNLEAEKSVIGAILIDPECILKIIETVKPEDFYDPRNKSLMEGLYHIYNERTPIDLVTLNSYLKSNGKIKEVGGIKYYTEIINETPTSANVIEYAKIVKELSTRRAVIKYATNAIELARDESLPLEGQGGSIGKIESELFSISAGNIKKDFVDLTDILDAIYQRAEDAGGKGIENQGCFTGFKNTDKLLSGFQPSDLIILGARPSVGKTAFALDLTRAIALDQKKTVGFFSIEMSKEQLGNRLLSKQAGVNLQGLIKMTLMDDEMQRIGNAMAILEDAKILIDDSSSLTISELRTKTRRAKLERNLDIIIIDYLQLIRGNNKENRTQEVSEISRELKAIARELQVPVIALAQLSRALESRNDKKPQLSDLRESGSIEQDADVVMFLHREDMHSPDQNNAVGKMELIIAKHRNGPTGIVEFQFLKEQAKYIEK